jgi:alkanesulfonate monooxygenase SsuD/methylene tetrahydromethanopterin reductase-like flavin-dependent oxidoreductase (luciferase family)
VRGNNRLKLGLFGLNCSSGNIMTTVPERWSGSWEDSLNVSQAADAAGIEFVLPIARWKGFGGETDYQGTALETITWATGILARTRNIMAFGTVHVPLFHPVIAAKQMVTAHHVGEGRFGLNIVCGWNEGEFDMLGIEQRDHESRYRYAQEWLDVVRALWSNPDEFDFAGDFFQLRNVKALPKPFGGRQPIVMNAGFSPTGQDFAIRNCDALFTFANTAGHIAQAKAKAGRHGRTVDVYTIGKTVCRPSAAEAREYHDYAVVERADWPGIDNLLAVRGITPETLGAAEFEEFRMQTASARGSLALVGDPDTVAAELARLCEMGLAGVALIMVDYAAELPFFCDEVLPRLERMNLRAGPANAANR